jgi:hypothetical protein
MFLFLLATTDAENHVQKLLEVSLFKILWAVRYVYLDLSYYTFPLT